MMKLLYLFGQRSNVTPEYIAKNKLTEINLNAVQLGVSFSSIYQ